MLSRMYRRNLEQRTITTATGTPYTQGVPLTIVDHNKIVINNKKNNSLFNQIASNFNACKQSYENVYMYVLIFKELSRKTFKNNKTAIAEMSIYQ